MPKITAIHLKRIQIKSFEAAKRLAAAVEEIEAVCGVRVCKIKISDPFICPDLRVEDLEDYGIEGCIKDILTDIRSATAQEGWSEEENFRRINKTQC